VRVGDTVLTVDEADGAAVDDLLVVRVVDFDEREARGRVEIVENRGGR
jgi:hypothetical protein